MSGQSPDARPRPKYGEYATPQQQAEVVAKSMPPLSPLLIPSDHAESVPVPSGAITPEAATKKTRPRWWDLVISVALLALGLWNVLGGFVQFSDVSAVIRPVFEMQGIGEFTPTAAARNAGIVVIVSNVVLFAVATWLTARRLMTGKLAFWIPIATGFIAFVVTMVAIGAVIVADPAFVSYVDGMR